jgi:acetoacetyl-CoA synthetase
VTSDRSAKEAIWTPSADRVKRAALTRFSHYVHERYQAPVNNYALLHHWSVEFPESFWSAVWDFCEVRCSRRAHVILEDGAKLPGARWFVGARFNYAENLLRLDGDAPAIIFRNERGQRRELSWRELRSEVARVADGLKHAGVKQGDRVAGYLPNVPEAVIAMLAASSIGAIWSSCSPDFAASALIDRFGQIKPRVLFAVDGYQYAGKTVDCLPVIDGIERRIPSIEHIVLIPYVRDDSNANLPANTVLFSKFGDPQAKLSFAQLPFEQPAFIL